MARIRTIKPKISFHEKLFDLEQETGYPIRFIWAVLPCHCDREGNFEWRPRPLGSQIVPYDGIDFSRVLHALATRGFVVAYRVEDEWYGRIPTFTKHQVVNNRESSSDIPPFEDAEEVWNGDSTTCTREPREDDACGTRAVHAQAEGKGREGKGREGKDTHASGARPAKPKPVEPDWCNEIKAIYPKRAGGQRWADALKACNARVDEGHEPQELIAGARRYAEYVRVKGDEGTEFVQQAATFFGRNKGFLESWAPPKQRQGRSDENAEQIDRWLQGRGQHARVVGEQ